MLRALGEYHVGGIPTTLPFFRWMLEQPAFVSGELDTTMLDAELERRAGEPFVPATADAPADGAARHGVLGVPRRAPGRPRRPRAAGGTGTLGLGGGREACRAQKVESCVAMRLHIEQDGRVRQVTIASGAAPETVDVHLDDAVLHVRRA